MRIIVIILLFMNAISALAAGYSFIADPSGKGLGMTTKILMHSPFNDFLIPGIILFMVNGIFSLVVAIIVIRKSKYYAFLISLQGFLLTGWIVVQLILLQFFHPLHFIMGIIGIFFILSGYFLKPNKERIKQ